MKRIVVLVLGLVLLVGLMSPSAGTATYTGTWQSLAGPTGGSVAAVALSPAYATDHTVFAGLRGPGIFRSETSGNSWEQVGPSDLVVVDIGVSPAYSADGTVFATTGFGVAGYTLYRSTDAGDSWNEITLPWSGLPSMPPRVVISSDFASDEIVYVIAGSQSFVSTDGGATFAAVGSWFATHNVIELAFSPAYAADETLYALVASNGLYKSTDGGTTWNPTGLTGSYSTFAISPDFANDARLLAVRQGDGQVRASTNGGTTWSDSSLTLDPAGTHTLRFSPTFAGDGLILAASSAEAGVYRSTDSGATWTLRGVYDPNSPFSGGFVDDGPYDMAVTGSDPSDPRAFAGTSSGLYLSLNRGEHWFQSDAALSPLTIRALATAPGDGSIILAGTSYFDRVRFDSTALVESDGNLHLSTDGGQSWQHVTGRLEQIRAVAFSPDFANDETAFAAAGTLGQHGYFDGGVYRSTNGGFGWEEVLSDRIVPAIAVSPQFATDRTVWASALTYSQALGIYRSIDGGTTWDQIAPSINAQYLVVSPNYAADQTLFAGTPNGVQKSTNSGAAWAGTGLNGNVTALAISPAYGASQTLYAAVQNASAGTPGTLHRSTDGGATWSQLTTGAPDSVDGDTRLFTRLRFAHDGSLLAGVSYGTDEAAAYRSTDGGSSWEQVDGTFDGQRLYALETIPTSSMTFYAGTTGGLWELNVPQGEPAEPGTWTSGGPRGGRAKALAVSPTFASDGVAFTGDWLMGRGATAWGIGMLRSTDGAQTWTRTDEHPEGALYGPAVFDYAVSPTFAGDGVAFAATWGGIYKTADSGDSWSLITSLPSAPPVATTVVAVAPDFGTSGHVTVGRQWGGLYVSSDGGESWTPAADTVAGVSDIVYSPDFATDRTIYLANGISGGVSKSTDAGLHWTEVFSGSAGTLAISPNYTNDRTVFAAGTDGVHVSTDAGVSWSTSTITTGVPGADALAVPPTYQDDQVVFAGNRTGLYQSNDGGQSWFAVPNYPAGVSVYAIAISPSWPAHNVLLVGTPQGVYRSTDGGGSWTRTQGLVTLRTTPLARSRDGGLLLTGAADFGVYASTDGGASWTPRGFQASGSSYGLPAAAISPAYPGDQTLFVATSSGVSIGGSVHRSTDGGVTWENVFNTDFVGSIAVSPDFAIDQTVYASGKQGRVVRSTAGGAADTWAEVGTFPTGFFSPGITRVAVPPAGAYADGPVFAGGQGFWRLPAGASEWQLAASGLDDSRRVSSIAVSPDYATDTTLLATASWSESVAGPIRYGLYRSTDGGVNWDLMNTGLPFDSELTAVAFSPSYTGDTTAYALDRSQLYRSVDGGMSWTAVGAPPGTSYLSNMVVTGTRSLYVTSDTGVWKYTTPATDVIINGGFEVDSGWEMPSTAWTAGYSDEVAYDGARSGRIGIDNGSNVRSYSSARQTVTIPENVESALLTFYQYPVSGEATMVARSAILQEEDDVTTLSESVTAAGDAQYLLVMQPNSSVVLETLDWRLSNAQSWHEQSFDLTKYAGQSIVLHFGVFNDGAGGRTGMYVDNAALLIETKLYETYLPLLLKQ